MPEEKNTHTRFKMPSFELTPPVSILLAGVIIAGAILYTNHRGPAVADATGAAPTQAQQQTVTKVPMPSSSDHIVGSVNAPIALVEYSDFQCPYCQMIFPSLKKAQQESNGQISWVMREFPLYQIHPNAMPAANAAECIAEQLGNDGWWKFAEDDFNNQQGIGTDFFTAEAKKLGVDMNKYNACVSNSTYLNKIEQEIQDAESNGGNGTPFTVVINTKTGKQYPISGALPYPQIAAVIEQAKAGK